MNVYYGLEHNFGGALVAVGSFDGVHSGHTRLIEHLNTLADSECLEPVVLTFEPHPRVFFGGLSSDFRLLSTLSERLHLLELSGARNVVVVDFDLSFSMLSPRAFAVDYLRDGLGCIGVVVGCGHTFGRGGCDFRYSDFGLLEYPIERYDSISSSLVRDSLLSGDFDLVTDYLGRGYYVETPVDLSLKLFPLGEVFLCERDGFEVLLSRSELINNIDSYSVFVKKKLQ